MHGIHVYGMCICTFYAYVCIGIVVLSVLILKQDPPSKNQGPADNSDISEIATVHTMG